MTNNKAQFSYIHSKGISFARVQSGVVATQEQCSSGQNSGCGSNSADIARFKEIGKNSPARTGKK